MEQTSASPATNNAIRGAEQSGNLAKQQFARKGIFLPHLHIKFIKFGATVN